MDDGVIVLPVRVEGDGDGPSLLRLVTTSIQNEPPVAHVDDHDVDLEQDGGGVELGSPAEDAISFHIVAVRIEIERSVMRSIIYLIGFGFGSVRIRITAH